MVFDCFLMNDDFKEGVYSLVLLEGIKGLWRVMNWINNIVFIIRYIRID